MFPKDTKFLIVDDSGLQRKIIRLILAEIGYRYAVEADNGQHAVQILKASLSTNSPIKFIISDWNMPKMSGIDLLRVCRTIPEYADIPFILVTCKNEVPQIIEAASLNVSEYIVKPFDIDMINEKIELICDRTLGSRTAKKVS